MNRDENSDMRQARYAESLAVVAFGRGGPKLTSRAHLAIQRAGGLDALRRLVEAGEPVELPPPAQRRVVAAMRLARHAESARPSVHITCAEDVYQHMGAWYQALDHEEVWAIGLNSSNNVIAKTLVSKGGRHGAALTAADVLRPMLRIGAACFVLVHNHPGGSPQPSREDVHMTERVRKAAEAVDCLMVDHVVIGRGRHTSMLQHEVMLRAAEPSR